MSCAGCALDVIPSLPDFLCAHPAACSDIKSKLRYLLKFSPEKWDEVIAHAQSAVAPDFNHRTWSCTRMGVRLVFACKNGAVQLEAPVGEPGC